MQKSYMRRYISIDIQVLQKSKLSLMEWSILDNIQFLSTLTGFCYASRQSLADHHQLSVDRYKHILVKLVADKWLSRNKKNELKTTKKWLLLVSVEVDTRSTEESGETDTRPMTKPTRLSYKERELRKGGGKKFKNYMDILEFIRENCLIYFEAKSVFYFEDIEISISKYGKIYNRDTLDDLSHSQETRFLSYLLKNADLLDII